MHQIKKKMKKIITSISIIVLSITFASAQCTPDAYTGNTGFILPDSTNFPHTQVNVPLNATIKIQVAQDTAGSFTVPVLGVPTTLVGTFTFDSITIHGVSTNPPLPSGVTLQYTCNPANCKFLGANTGCIQLSVSAISSVGVYRIYVDAVAKGTFASQSFPLPFPNQSIAQTVDRYKIVVDPTGTFIGEFDGDENSLNFLSMQPNPAQGNADLKFYSPTSLISKISLVDIQGKILLTELTTTQKGINNKTINLKNISNGIYFLNIENNGKMINKKLVVQH